MPLLTLCLATLMAQLDTAIVNLATHAIGQQLGADVRQLQWMVDSYNIVYAAALLSGGLLADLLGRRAVFVAGAALFGAASLLCAAAPSLPVLIGGRTLAGLGAALMIPASLAIVRVLWLDPAERGRALGLWAGCNGVGLAIGPTLGGLLLPLWGWRSIFLVVVPLAAATALLAWRVIPESRAAEGRSFDAPAQLAGAGALAALAFAAIELRARPGVAVASLALALLALLVLLRIEARRGPAALIPLEIFAAPAFSGAMAATASMTFGMFGMLFLVPLAWQQSGRLGPTDAGIALVPMALAFIAVSALSGPLAQRIGRRAATAGGVAIIALGMLVIALAPASLAGAEAGLILTGLGMGVASGPLMGVAVDSVPEHRAGTASALINVARMAGATLGVATLGAVFAFGGEGEVGLRAALLLGAAIQLAGAAGAAVTGPRRVPGKLVA